jgi:hypothetical protein
MGQVYAKCISVLSLTKSMRNSTLLTLLRSSIHRKITTSTAAKMPVQRITMFKVADEADVPQFLEKYQTLAQDQQKVRDDCIERWNTTSS